ncbi:MAG TPA: hypothetical protein PLY93_04035 [Turneriella sp.]|nr:hypothetical protein [Turneriella sp.]
MKKKVLWNYLFLGFLSITSFLFCRRGNPTNEAKIIPRLTNIALPQTGCNNILEYARKTFTAEGDEVRVYDNPTKKGPYHWKQKFKEGVIAEGYGSVGRGTITLTLPIESTEPAFEICRRCTSFFHALTYQSFKDQNEVLQECGGRTKQGGCLVIWSIETVRTKDGVRLKCGPESM